MMKKFFLTVLVGAAVLCSLFSQNAGPKDLILVLDTSSSMSDYDEEVSDYLIGPFLREYLRLGDTFHLISFSDEPKLELSRRIRETGDVETIIARLLLMHPLVRYTDIPSAVDFAEQYTAGLPGNRARRVVFITDGKNNAVPGSENAALSSNEISALLSSGISARFSAIGANVDYVSVPLSSDVSGGNAPPLAAPPPVTAPPAGQTPSRDTPSVQEPPPQRSNTPPAPPPTQNPPAAADPVTRLPSNDYPPAVQAPSGNAPAVPAARNDTESSPQSSAPIVSPETRGETAPPPSNQQSALPPSSNLGGAEAGTPLDSQEDHSEEIAPPSRNIPADNNQVLEPQNEERPVPSAGETTALNREKSSLAAFFGNIPWLFIILLILLLALIIGLVIFFITRKVQRSPGKAVYEAANSNASAQQKDDSANKNAEMLASYAAGQRKGSGAKSPYTYRGKTASNAPPINGPLMLSLFVEDQNTAIGRRNIHTAKSGTTLTVGGGKSDFLMFLVPMPPHIAEVRFDGKNCTFVPKKPKLFPDIGSESIPNCIGQTIRVLSERNYELFIRIERFQDPLLELNRLMNSISLPGSA